MSRRLLPTAVLAGLTAASAACALNPATGKTQISLVSEAQEISMGKEYDPQVAATMGLYAQDDLQRYIQELGTGLAARSERPALPWSFRVVDDAVVNAFALPGGFIYVTRGILAHCNSEAELAAVVGHEIGHVTARHSAQQMTRQQLTQLGFAVGSFVSPSIAQFGNLASAALNVLFLKNGRDAERQADELGLRYMRRGDFAVREMPDVFTMLERVSATQGGKRTPEWLATHPNPENRRERILALIAALPPDSLGRIVNRAGYLRRIDGIVYGEDPRQGFFRGSEFLHPDLRFRIRFPEGWATRNQRQAVMAAPPGQDAVLQVTLAQQPTADAAARAFFLQQGIVTGSARQEPINGLRTVAAPFAVATADGEMRGLAAFVEHAGRVFRLMGYAPAPRWRAYDTDVERAVRSFARVTDPTVLAIEPWRIDVVTVDRPIALAELALARRAPVTLETLALINQLTTDAVLAPGDQVKWITGQPLP